MNAFVAGVRAGGLTVLRAANSFAGTPMSPITALSMRTGAGHRVGEGRLLLSLAANSFAGTPMSSITASSRRTGSGRRSPRRRTSRTSSQGNRPRQTPPPPASGGEARNEPGWVLLRRSIFIHIGGFDPWGLAANSFARLQLVATWLQSPTPRLPTLRIVNAYRR
jgi:hypothetical protein